MMLNALPDAMLNACSAHCSTLCTYVRNVLTNVLLTLIYLSRNVSRANSTKIEPIPNGQSS